MKKIAVCLLSGGLDSAVAVDKVYEEEFQLHCIFFDWGQKTYKKELYCAKALSKYYKAELIIIEIPLLKTLPCISLTKQETLTTAINEYVPNRNAILETQAVAYAEFLKANVVCVGSTGGDHICPDNSPQFISAMQEVINEGTMLKPSMKIIAPLINTDKGGVVKLGMKLKVPFELTWSCHNNNDQVCGKCSNCISRLEAFQINQISDPIQYHISYQKN